jgi:hypothetical protein
MPRASKSTAAATTAKKPSLRVVTGDASPAAETGDRASGSRRRLDVSKLGVVDQARVAFQGDNRLPTAMGFILGGFAPIATFATAHHQYNPAVAWYAQVATVMVLGGLLFSAITVYKWARLAFSMPAKAVGFVLAVEGVMTFSTMPALSFAALALLVCINGIATGCHLALGAGRVATK